MQMFVLNLFDVGFQYRPRFADLAFVEKYLRLFYSFAVYLDLFKLFGKPQNIFSELSDLLFELVDLFADFQPFAQIVFGNQRKQFFVGVQLLA